MFFKNLHFPALDRDLNDVTMNLNDAHQQHFHPEESFTAQRCRASGSISYFKVTIKYIDVR